MNILIMGGNRFVGKKLAECLSKTHNTTIFNRSGSGPSNCNIITGDRNLSLDIIKEEYDVIVDFCLFTEDQSIRLTSHLRKDQPYIFISSGVVYKDSNNMLYNEDMPIGGRSGFGTYGVEKSRCEDVISHCMNNYIILRPPYIIGTNSHRPRIEYYINNIKNNLPVEVAGKGEKILSFIWIDDMVNVIIDMVSNFDMYKVKKTYNIVSEEFYTSKSLITEVSEYLNMTATIVEDGKNSPFIDEHLMLSPLKLGRKFSTIKDILPNFI